MLKKSKQGYYEFNKLKKFKSLIHGFSTRKFGDMGVKNSLTENRNLDKFLRIFNLEKKNLVMMEQGHGNKVKVVGETNKGKVIPGVDGMVTSVKGVILGVKVADCLPVLFYDPIKKLIGIAHLTCTSCQSQDFFSYRKERTNERILGIIGLIN